MDDAEDPPPDRGIGVVRNPIVFPRGDLPGVGKKKILLTPLENRFSPPHGLKTSGKFERKATINPAVTQKPNNRDEIVMLYRLIYRDGGGWNSCIVRRDGHLYHGDVVLEDWERTAFQARPPHGMRGLEDFRFSSIDGEEPTHGFVVEHDDVNARTTYTRTSTLDPYNFDMWDDFGITFPNISTEEAMALVKDKQQEKIWDKMHGKKAIKEAIKAGKDIPANLFLGTKDVGLLPRKIWKDLGDGRGRQQYYAPIIRLFPKIQIIYIDSFEQLARLGLWRETVSHLGERTLLESKYAWEESHLGLGPQPREVGDGFLLEYHGARMKPKRNYGWGLALLDRDDPQKVLARSPKPIHQATESWETNPRKNRDIAGGSIVFPTGSVIDSSGIAYGFYGAADRYTGVVTSTLTNLLDQLVTVN